MSLNLHDIVGDRLTVVNDWQTMIFTKTMQTYNPSNLEPTTTTETITIQGKLQPLSPTELYKLGFNIRDYQYYRIYVSSPATTLSEIDQRAADTFTCNGYEYRLVGGIPWDDSGWRECYCYQTRKLPDDTQTNNSVPGGVNPTNGA